MNPLQIFVIQNTRFAKFFLKKRRVNLLILTKCFLKISGQSHMIIMIILMLGTLHFSFALLITLGFYIGVMRSKIKMIFQTGFMNGGYLSAPFKTSFVHKSRKDILISLNMVVVLFWLLVQGCYSSFQNFKFLGFFVGTLFSYRWFLLPFLRIWPDNSKLNGGQNFLLQMLNNFLLFVNGLQEKNSPSKPSPSKEPSPIPTDALLLSITAFPSDKEFIKHLKLLKKKASETLSQFSGSSSDDDDTASSAFLGDVNEDMYRGLPYTPLGWCIQDFLRFHFQISSKVPDWATCQRIASRLHSWQMCSWFLGVLSSQFFKGSSPAQTSQNPGNGQPHISNWW